MEHAVPLCASTLRVAMLQLEAAIPHDKKKEELSGRKRYEWVNGAGEPRIERAVGLVEALAQESPPPHVILFSEYTIPLWQDAIDRLQAVADRTGIVLVCGADNATPESIVGDRILTKSAVIRPGMAPVFVEKGNVSPHEQEHGYVDEPPDPRLHVFAWASPEGDRYWFTVQVCFNYFEFADKFRVLVRKHGGTTFASAPGVVLATLCSKVTSQFQNKADLILRDDARRIPSIICNTIGGGTHGGSCVVVNNLDHVMAPITLSTEEEECRIVALDLTGLALAGPFAGDTRVPIRLSTRRLLDGDRMAPPDGIRFLEPPVASASSPELVKEFYRGSAGASLRVAAGGSHARPNLETIVGLVPAVSSGFRVIVIQGGRGAGKSLLLHQVAARVLARVEPPIVVDLLSSTRTPSAWSYLAKLARSRHVVVLAESAFDDPNMVNAIAEVDEAARITLVATTNKDPRSINAPFKHIEMLHPPDVEEKRALAAAIRSSLGVDAWTVEQQRLIESEPRASIQTATWVLARGKADWILDDLERLANADPHLAIGCAYVYFAHAKGIETPRSVLGHLDDQGQYTLLPTLKPTRHLVVPGERNECVAAQHQRVAEIGAQFFGEHTREPAWMFRQIVEKADPSNVEHRRFVSHLTRALLADTPEHVRSALSSPAIDAFWMNAATFTDVYYWKLIWERSGDAARATRTDARLLMMEPASSWECMMRMNIHRAREDVDGAVAVARAWLAREPEDGHGWSIAAHLLVAVGKGRADDQKWAFDGLLRLAGAGKAGAFELGALTSLARAMGGAAAEHAAQVLGVAKQQPGAAPSADVSAIQARLREGGATAEEATTYALAARLADDETRQDAATVLLAARERFDSPAFRRALATLLAETTNAAEARDALARDLVARVRSGAATRFDAEALGIVTATSGSEIVGASADALAEAAQSLPIGLLSGFLSLLEHASATMESKERMCQAFLARIHDPDATATDIEAFLRLAELCSAPMRAAALDSVGAWIASHDDSNAARQKWVSFVEENGDVALKKATRHDTYRWLEKHPTAVGVWVAYLGELQRSGFRTQADRRAKKALASNPGHVALERFSNASREKLRRLDVEALRRDAAAKPADYPLKRLLATALSARSGSPAVGATEADALYRELLYGERPLRKTDRSKTWFRVLSEYSEHLRYSGRALMAAELLQNIPDRLPPPVQARLLRARAHTLWYLTTFTRSPAQAGEFATGAERDFREALARASAWGSETAGLLGDLGRFQIKRDRPREAAATFRAALDAFRDASEPGEPDDAVGLAFLAIALHKCGGEDALEARATKLRALEASKAAEEPFFGEVLDQLHEIG